MSGTPAACTACGSTSLFGVASNAIVTTPAGVPCAGCGGVDEPLHFRGWVRRTAYLIASSESRASGYVCPRCAERSAAAALAWTGVLGWWSISSFLFRTPVATFHNWLSAFRPPVDPLAWGAVPAAGFGKVEAAAGDATTPGEAFARVRQGVPA